MKNNIDIERLKEEIIDYYGTAMNNGFNMAIVDIEKVERASDEEIIKIARKIGINIEKYKTYDFER